MGRSSSDKCETINFSRKRSPKKQKDLVDHEKNRAQKSNERIYRHKQSISLASTNFTDSFEKEKTEDYELCCKECMNGEDEEDLMVHIQILLDSHPKCNFVQQILQRLCNEGTMTREMIAYFIDRSIRKRREILKQINILKNNQVKKC